MARTYNELNEMARKAQEINKAQGETLIALANAINGLEDGKVNVIDVENIKALTDEQCNSLRCGDIVRKITDGQKHCYIVTFKKDNVGICLTYIDATVVETQSYDYTDSHWVYNSEDKNLLEPYELPVATDNILGGVKVGSGLTINDGVLSASGGNSYTHILSLSFNTYNTAYGLIRCSIVDNDNTPITTSNIVTRLSNVLGQYKGLGIPATGDYEYLSDDDQTPCGIIIYQISISGNYLNATGFRYNRNTNVLFPIVEDGYADYQDNRFVFPDNVRDTIINNF